MADLLPERALYEEANHDTRSVKKTIDIAGTTIREHILRNNQDWRQYIPIAVQKFFLRSECRDWLPHIAAEPTRFR